MTATGHTIDQDVHLSIGDVSEHLGTITLDLTRPVGPQIAEALLEVAAELEAHDDQDEEEGV